MIWFTSDHHFGHHNIIKYCNRPFTDVKEMNRVMEDRWNKLIRDNDLVYYVGDFSFMDNEKTQQLLNRLNGNKILIQGNHDKSSLLPMGFNLEIRKAALIIADERVNLSHYPYKATPEEEQHAKENNYKLKFQDRRLEDDGNWLIHGHVHEKWKIKRKMINVSVDVWDFYPVSIDEIGRIISAG